MKHMVTPVVFIHGLWLHADSWGAWVKLFRRLGYEASAPGWPREPSSIHEARLLPEEVAGIGIQQVADHYAKIIKQMDAKPVVVGHSFGGLVAQKLLGDDNAAAAIVISSAQPKGVWRLPPRQLASAYPALKNPLNYKRAVALTAQEFRYGFGNALTMEESTELYTMWSIPSPGRPLFEVAAANFLANAPSRVNVANAERGPLLLIAGERDNTVPPSSVRAQQKLYEKSPAITDIQEFPNRGHSMPIDTGWREIADSALAWLKLRVH